MKFSEYVNEFKYTGNGVGKETPIHDVDKKELLVGIAVEFEHTDDMDISTSIAIDHLTENSEYYTILLKTGLVDEEKAIYLGNKYLNVSETDTNIETEPEKSKDEIEGDVLLGYEPKNVGDGID